MVSEQPIQPLERIMFHHLLMDVALMDLAARELGRSRTDIALDEFGVTTRARRGLLARRAAGRRAPSRPPVQPGRPTRR